MVTLNSRSEVADILDVSQFVPGKSAYECVAYSASLLKFCGQPGHGPTGSVLEASNLAQYFYGLEEGSNAASNTNGMSLEAEYDMLKRMGLHYEALATNVSAVKAALQKGYPVIMCGAETGMHDLELGDAVPYNWTPTGNHAIVASGIASDGNLLVHDCASVSSNGVRPGPRHYDAARLQLVSATAIIPSWLEDIVIDLNTPGIGNYFELVNGNQWRCKQTQKIIHGAILAEYCKYGNAALCGLTFLGLPLSNEIAITGQAPCVKQYFERGVLVYDPAPHKLDNPPGAGDVYNAHLYNGIGTDPIIATLQAQIAQLQTQSSDAPLAAIKQIQTLVAPFK